MGTAAIDVTGEIGEASEEQEPKLAAHGFPPETPVGISGLEKAFNRRLAGKPGGKLLAVSANAGKDAKGRVLAESKPEPGAPVKTTIDPYLQETAVAALAGRFGGVAVLDTKTGDVRALAGQAFSAPQPPGSTFKIITTVAALQKNLVKLDDEFEVTDGINVGGRFIENANGEYCGGTFLEAFAESCNADFLPLGPQIGNQKMVETAEAFGFNSPPTLYSPSIVKEVEPAESTIPKDIGEEVDLGGVGDRPGRGAGDAAADGERRPDDRQRRRADADLDRLLAETRPDDETGAGDVEEDRRPADRTDDRRRHRRDRHRGRDRRRAGGGEDGHRRTRPVVESEEGEEPVEGEEEVEPQHKKDAWFSAFATVEKPKLAIGVLLIEAEAAGGEVAAPIASQVLAAGYE